MKGQPGTVPALPAYPASFVYALARLGNIDAAKAMREKVVENAPVYRYGGIAHQPLGMMDSLADTEVACMDVVISDAANGQPPDSVCRFTGPRKYPGGRRGCKAPYFPENMEEQ